MDPPYFCYSLTLISSYPKIATLTFCTALIFEKINIESFPLVLRVPYHCFYDWDFLRHCNCSYIGIFIRMEGVKFCFSLKSFFLIANKISKDH